MLHGSLQNGHCDLRRCLLPERWPNMRESAGRGDYFMRRGTQPLVNSEKDDMRLGPGR